MAETIDALETLRPNSRWRVDHTEAGDVLVWHEDNSEAEPTQSELDTEMARLQAIEDSQAYARNRKAEYDQLNQFEMQFDDDRDGTTTWVDKINEIKGRHPK